MDTPYQWTKQVASHWGGTRNGTIVHWPNGIAGQGRAAPPVPPRHRRRPDRPRGGRAPRAAHGQRHRRRSRSRASACATLRRRRRRRAARDPVLRDVLQPRHLPPGLDRGDPPLARRGSPAEPRPVRRRRVGALRHRHDWTQAHDLAAEQPDEARRAQAALPASRRASTTCCPLDDRRVERFNSDLAGRPHADHGATRSCSSAAWAG